MDNKDFILKFVNKSPFCNYNIFSDNDDTCVVLKYKILKISKELNITIVGVLVFFNANCR